MTTRPAPTPSALDGLVIMRASEVQSMVKDAVVEALAQSRPEAAWLSTDQLAAEWGVSKGNITKLARSGSLPSRRIGKQYRFRRDEVEAWLEQQAMKPGGHSALHTRRLRIARSNEKQEAQRR